ncbi:zinc-binding dehydrogenase [Nonomuraea sp. LPB2021202275-12-8]|uniref:zinc-binding dehydrogenase n=1 Tax=Nonomuraea sp. LPB2021202275-12-8 TaxID=3120159 RepID=UPI00300CBAAC
MHAIRLHSYGPPENLRFETLPDPVPGPGQVRVAVRAAGLHFIETLLRRGIPVGPHPAPDLPVIFGNEVAGVVESAGADVDPALLGRRVVTSGVTSGGYASLAVASAEDLTLLPDDLEYGAAVAMNTTGATTLGLLELVPVTSADVVLAMAAAGGIGTLLVQHALRAGATVVGAAGGPAKVSRVAGQGADFAVDYTEPGWTDRVREAVGEVSVVFDGVGGRLGREAFELIGKGGRQVAFGQASGESFQPDEEDAAARGITAHNGIGYLLGRPGGTADLGGRALEEVAAGRLTPAVQSFPLREAAAAHAALENRDTMGKVVLTP